MLSRSSATVLRYSRPETNDEVFEIYGPEESVATLVRVISRLLPHSIEWEPSSESIKYDRDTHRGEWRCDLKPTGRIDENLMAHFDKDAIANLGPELADNTTERNTNGR